MATKPRHQKTAVQLWVVDNRKRLGLTPHDLAVLTGVTDDTARAWESRGSPSQDALEILQRRFGVPLPNAGGRVDQSADSAALISAMTQALLAHAQAFTDLRTDLANSRAAARSEREALTKMLARIEARLSELEPPGDTASAAAVQATGHQE